ncbi:Ig-like domain-containing protein, partial [Chloroflexus sp.]|uniref:Ig-like domain-containing protein n=4 Tax=Chloroflexus sp. TaxID=1904827 RepID=UPI00404AB18F
MVRVIDVDGYPFQIVYTSKTVSLVALPPLVVEQRGGNNQSAVVDTDFAQPLEVWVGDENGNPLSGVYVSFTAPASGASAVFPAGNGAVSDTNGLVQVPVRANNVAGTYTVTASVANASTDFTLTNIAATPSPTPSPSATASVTPEPTASATPSPSATASVPPEPTASTTPSPSATASVTPSPS